MCLWNLQERRKNSESVGAVMRRARAGDTVEGK